MQNKVDYYESLGSAAMKSKRKKKEEPQSKVKQLIFEWTSIKRPQNKSKYASSENLSARFKGSTLPKSPKTKEAKKAKKNAGVCSKHFDEEYKLSRTTSEQGNKKDSKKDFRSWHSDVVRHRQRLDNLFDEVKIPPASAEEEISLFDITWTVSADQNGTETEGSSKAETGSSSKGETESTSKSETESISRDEAESSSDKTEGSSKDNTDDLCDNLAKVDLDDDIFGLNDFSSANGDDNYIVEAYNDDDKELIFTFFEVERRSAKLSDNSSNISELFSMSDVVVHENEKDEIKVLKHLDNSERVDLNDLLMRSESDKPTASERPDQEPVAASQESQPVAASPESNYVELYFNEEVEYMYPLYGTEAREHDEHKSKLSYIIDELVFTEEQYVVGLHKVVNDYEQHFRDNNLLPNLRVKYLFGNIRSIYNEAKQFLQLLKSQEHEDVEGIANAFLTMAAMFELYPEYSRNRPRAEFYLKEFNEIIKTRQNELGDRLNLASYLLTPVQRLGKYILMLENIQKQLTATKEPSQKISIALSMIKKQMKRGNDIIAIDSIKLCPVDLTKKGCFIMREEFSITKPKKFEAMVFLFENIVVFAENASRTFEEFIYVDSIEMSDLIIASFESEPLVFHLSDYAKIKKGSSSEKYTFVLESKSSKIKQNWTQCIQKILWEQLEQVKVQQKLLAHDNDGKRTSKIPMPVKSMARSNLRSSKKMKTRKKSNSIFYDNSTTI